MKLFEPGNLGHASDIVLTAAKAQQCADAMLAAARHAARMCLQEGWWQLQRAEREFQEAAVQLAATAAAQGCSSAAADHRDASSQCKKSKQCSGGDGGMVEHAGQQQMVHVVGAVVQARDAWQDLQELLASCGKLRL
jgi:hypothetical protein